MTVGTPNRSSIPVVGRGSGHGEALGTSSITAPSANQQARSSVQRLERTSLMLHQASLEGVQPKLAPMLIQQGGKLRAVWRAEQYAKPGFAGEEGVGDSRMVYPPPLSARSTATNSTAQENNAAVSAGGRNGAAASDKALLQEDRDASERALHLQARFEALHADSAQRMARLNQSRQEKLRREEAERVDVSGGSSAKKFDPEGFGKRYRRVETTLRERAKGREIVRRQNAALKEVEEMAECTFKPKLVARSAAQRRETAKERDRKILVQRLGAGQKAHLQDLEQVGAEEEEYERQLRRECEAELEEKVGSASSRDEVEEFLRGDAGRKALADRVQAYIEANPGIGEVRATEEARKDVAKAREAALREELMERFKEKRRLGRKRMQIRRLHLVHKLAQLEAQYAALEFVGQHGEFDPNLVATLKQQEWYILAKHTAAQALAANA